MNFLKFIRVYFNKNLAMDKQLSIIESLKSSKKKKAKTKQGNSRSTCHGNINYHQSLPGNIKVV